MIRLRGNWSEFEAFLLRAKEWPERRFVAHRRRLMTSIIRRTCGPINRPPGVAGPGTPVDTGELRNSWELTVNRKADGQRQTSSPITDALEVLASAKKAKDRLFWQNNAPHAAVIEFGLFEPSDPGPSKDPRPDRRGVVLVRGGFSTQAPTGVLGDAIQAALTEASAPVRDDDG